MPRVFRALAKDRESGWAFTLLLCVPYFLFLLWMHVHHEMWRDEIHAWDLARAAQGFWDLVTGERRYEGHPPLWFWYLHVWSWFAKSAWGIQAGTIAAATTAAVLFARFAPFPRYLKVMVLFSYYFGYEYAVMSRNYVLGWLLVCVFCAVYHPLRVRPIAAGLALALLALTSAYGLFMSILLLIFFLFDQVKGSLSGEDASPPTTWTLRASPGTLVTLALVSSAWVLCVLTIEPVDPNPFSPAFNFSALGSVNWTDVFSRLSTGFLPSCRFNIEFWSGPFAIWESTSTWTMLSAISLVLVAVAALFPSWRLMLMYLAMVVGMEMFHTVRFYGGIRHWGHFVMFFVAASWLLRTTIPGRRHWLSTVFLVLILAVQIRSLVIAAVVDTREVFSGGRETAAFIRKHGLQDLPIVAGSDYTVEAVTGYLHRPFTAAETEEVGENVVFHSRRHGFSPDELMRKAVRIARERKTPVLLISNYPLPAPPAGVVCPQLFRSRRSTVGDEVFTVYRLQAD